LIKVNPHTSEKYKSDKLQSLILLENEDHSRVKKLVQSTFSSSNIDKLRPYMRNYMNHLIDNVIELAECDIQKDIFDKYPVNMICKLFGVSDNDWILFNEWAKDTFKNFQSLEDTQIAVKAHEDFTEYATRLIEEKKNNLSDDLLSDLIRAEQSGSKLSSEELQRLIQTIMVAGIDTTRSQLGISFIMLADNPELWKSLSSDQNLRDKTIDESLRLDGVLKNLGRFASEDIVYKDILFPKGTVVYLCSAVSNYDSSVFKNPDDFDQDRSNLLKDTLSFGSGVHHCLGMNLARAELQEALSVLSERLPNIAVSDDIVYKDTIETVWGAISIPVTF
jgi:cytochrome P450